MRSSNAGLDVHVVDAGLPSASVAAGMYNPMSFRRIVEVWDAQAYWDAMQATYRRFEALLDQPFLHPLPIRKRIPNADYAALGTPVPPPCLGFPRWKPMVKAVNTGRSTEEASVDVKALILAWRDHFASRKEV